MLALRRTLTLLTLLSCTCRLAAQAPRDATLPRPRLPASRAQHAGELGQRGAVRAQPREREAAHEAELLRRRREDTTTVAIYESKAMLEYVVGRLHLRAGNRDAARAAFGRALTDDLGFRYAHVQLGELAAEDGDLATALHEYETALAAAPTDAWIRYRYALRLLEAKRWTDAERELNAARTAAPLFAAPLLPLARIRESAGDDDAAAALYRQFLETAPRDATAERTLARTRLASLTVSTP